MANEVRKERIVQMAVLRVGDEEYTIDIMRIMEIINPLPITIVPDSTSLLEGVINLRGLIIPIVDLRKRLGLPFCEDTRHTKYIIASVSTKIVGFRVDEVVDVVQVPFENIRPAPQMVKEREPGLCVGVCQYQERLLLLLNLKKVLSPAFFQTTDTEVGVLAT